MRKSLGILIAISFIGLFAQILEAKKQQSPVEKRAVISIGSDVVKKLHQQYSKLIDLKTSELTSSNNNEYSILSIPESQINQLSQIIHKDFNRCPGFFFHESIDEAKRFHQKPLKALYKTVDYSINNAETVSALLSQLTESNMT